MFASSVGIVPESWL